MANLAVAAAHGWRSVRAKLVIGGIADPLRDLATMHHILDVVEQLATEGKASESADAVQHFWFALYQPEPDEVPKDFEVEDEMAAFDAFATMASGMH